MEPQAKNRLCHHCLSISQWQGILLPTHQQGMLALTYRSLLLLLKGKSSMVSTKETGLMKVKCQTKCRKFFWAWFMRYYWLGYTGISLYFVFDACLWQEKQKLYGNKYTLITPCFDATHDGMELGKSWAGGNACSSTHLLVCTKDITGSAINLVFGAKEDCLVHHLQSHCPPYISANNTPVNEMWEINISLSLIYDQFLSNLFLKITRDGDSITALGNLFQCLTILTVRQFLLILNLNFLCYSLRPLLQVLSPIIISETSPSPPSL